jgi:hypothetical protein
VSSLRAALDQLFTELPAQLRAPGTGSAACRTIADLYDREIAARFQQARDGIALPLALVATGGWSRRELAPYSDIDFIILYEKDEAIAKQVADRLLYPLWDEKLAIGHSLREPRAVARLAREDLATATALLDARHIAGDRKLTSDLVRLTLGALSPSGNPNELIGMLASEKKARHDRFGASLYLLEPNLKQGIGALRDLATALWAAQVRWHPPRPDLDPEGADALVANLVALGHLTRRQGDVLTNARDFMLRIRILVQLAACESLLHRERVELMLIDRVHVIEVVLHAACRRGPLGHQRRQDAELVHDLERRRLCGIANVDERVEEELARRGIDRERRGVFGERLGRQLAGVAVHRQRLLHRDAKQPKHLARPFGEQARILDRELAVERDERGVDFGNARFASRGHARRLEQAVGDLHDAAGMPEVLAHQIFDGGRDG